MMRKILTLAAAALFLFAALALAEEAAPQTVEVGGILYSASDVDILKAFLEVDATGTLINPTYTPSDPATFGVEWAELDGVYRAVGIDWEDLQISGDLSLSGLDRLKTLSCSRNSLFSLDLTDCYQLTDVYCDDNQLESLNLSGCVSLTGLSADGNHLTSLDVSECVSLTSLFVSRNALTQLSLDGLPALMLVQCESNQLTGLTARGCASLESVYCQDNSLPFLSLAGCENLKTLSAQGNMLLAVNLTGCQQLSSLRLNDNQLTALPDLTGFTALTPADTDFSGNGFEHGDLTLLPDALSGDDAWLSAQASPASGVVAGVSEPVPDAAPAYDLTTLGNVLTNRQGTVFPYEAGAAREDEGWAAVVSALPNNDKYHQRNLTLSSDALTALKDAGFFEIALRMNDVTIYAPISELLETGASSFTLLVAPMPPEEWSKGETSALSSCELISGACRYRVAASTNGAQENISASLDALRVRAIVPAPESPESLRLYVVSNQTDNSDITYYVPSAAPQGDTSVFTADISGAGSGLVGLARLTD